MADSFKERVYEFTRLIPKGKVATYSQLAKMVGNPHAARAVGMCMRTNPDAPNTPCHRVVGADGSLIGYSAGEGTETKRQLLLKEGIFFNSDKVNLARSQWKV